MMERLSILNVSIDNLTLPDLLENLKQGGFVVTPNVDHLVRLQFDRDFYEIYNGADYRVCDSQIVKYASRFLGRPIQEKISGSDLFPAFYQYYKDDPSVTVFLLGAAEGVAAKAQESVNRKVNRQMVIGSYSPPFGFDKDSEECAKIIKMINDSKATVLVVGLGAPKQEKWIARFRSELTHVKVFLPLGATLDFEAGNVTRSPRWMSQVGLEWLYRLLMEPQRLWKRYLVDDLPFLKLILSEKFGFYRDPFAKYAQR